MAASRPAAAGAGQRLGQGDGGASLIVAAATQAPLTSFIIVMEMVDGHAMVLSLMACPLVASAVARVVSPPL